MVDWPGSIRVCSYSLLSPCFAEKENFKHSKGFMDTDLRYGKIIKVLEKEILQESIICLQEVCREWYEKLTVFFHRHNYVSVTGQQAPSFHDFAGQMIVFPRKLELLECCRLSPFLDRFPMKKKKHPEKYFAMFTSSLLALGVLSLFPNYSKMTSNLGFCGLAAASTLFHIYNREEKPKKFEKGVDLRLGVNARGRDVILMLKFKTPKDVETEIEKSFWIANVLMPKKFWNPSLMMTYAAVLAQSIQEKAGDISYIICGNWNGQPDSDVYKLLKNGKLKSCEIDIDGWKPEVTRMFSAYDWFKGREPQYTTFINTIKTGKFVGTLDYIWFNVGNWRVVSVDSIPKMPKYNKPKSWPCETEGSDHCKIGANFKFKK